MHNDPVTEIASRGADDDLLLGKQIVNRVMLALAATPTEEVARRVGLSTTDYELVMSQGTPSAALLVRLCSQFDLCADWLLLDEGPINRNDQRGWYVAQADANELGQAIGKQLERIGLLTDRLDKLSSSVTPGLGEGAHTLGA